MWEALKTERFSTQASTGPPFEFQMGKNRVIKGFEEAIRDMNVNDEKEVTIPPELAYGEYDDRKIKNFPIEDLRKHFEPEVGMSIGIKMDNGTEVPASIMDIKGDEVVIDMNHPYAGKTLKFKLIVLEINDEPKYDPSCFDCTCGGGRKCMHKRKSKLEKTIHIDV